MNFVDIYFQDTETPRVLTSPTFSTSSSRSFVVLPQNASKLAVSHQSNCVLPEADNFIAEFDSKIQRLESSLDGRTPANELNVSDNIPSTDLRAIHQNTSTLLSMVCRRVQDFCNVNQDQD